MVLAYPHVQVVGGLLACLLLFSLFLVISPALLKSVSVRGASIGLSVFFGCIGLAYMLIEVWAIHRFATYLGHQTYALGLVLAGMLLGSGAGSVLGERFAKTAGRRMLAALAGITLTLLIGLLGLPPLLEASVGSAFFVRAGLGIVYVLLLGLFMGVPFPAGLEAARSRAGDSIPWYVGINGFASVIATLAVLPLAHALGYVSAMLTGGALYLLASLALFASGRRGAAA
jgi:hypothetical protein